MRILRYVNANGDELEFTSSPPFILQKFDTTNNINIYNSKGMSQDGMTYLNNTLDIRDLSMEITILANNETEMISYRDKINKLFSPKLGEGYLVYTDGIKERKTKCIVNKIPYFTVINFSVYKCLINLTASNPFWTDILESKEEIALWKGDFSFDLEIFSDGIELGHREPSLIVNVNNPGDVECGMRVEFKALATLINPSILNVNTQEYIKINKTLVVGEVINITTYFGNKQITSTLNGATSNIFNFIDVQSTFLQLDVGDNLFRYNADTNLDYLECNIYYQPQYLGV